MNKAMIGILIASIALTAFAPHVAATPDCNSPSLNDITVDGCVREAYRVTGLWIEAVLYYFGYASCVASHPIGYHC